MGQQMDEEEGEGREGEGEEEGEGESFSHGPLDVPQTNSGAFDRSFTLSLSLT